MYRVPSSLQRKNKERTKLNLIPILDSVFIFIFFLLVSSNFINLKEITSDIPIISDSLEQDKEPLALTLSIDGDSIKVLTGLSSTLVKTFNFDQLSELRDLMIKIKEDHEDEKTIIFEPADNVDYEQMVKLMDIVRQTEENEELFSNIVFGNIME